MANINNKISHTNISNILPAISDLIEKQMKKFRITGLSIALVENQNTLWEKGFGFADKENKIEATEKTKYLIGSITKLFTGSAIMKLNALGKLDLDKPVTTYVPELVINTRRDSDKPITIRNLLTHHSGLPCDNFDKFYNDNPNNAENSFRNVVSYLNSHFTTFPPNYIWSYSNLAISLLGVIIEKVSGQDYCSYIKDNLLNPMDMLDSGTITEKSIVENISKTYRNNKYEIEGYLRDLPAGCIVSTVNDMTKFIKMVLAKGRYNKTEILNDKSIDDMFSCQNANIPLDMGFKMGLSWILEWPKFDYVGKVGWHDGSSEHYNGLIIVLPEQNLGVVLLSNSSTALPECLRIIADELLTKILEIRSCTKPYETIRQKITKNKNELKMLEGEFAGLKGVVSIKLVQESLRMKMSGMNLFLEPNNDGWFSIKLKLFSKIPIKLRQIENIRISINDINRERVMALEQTVSSQIVKMCFAREIDVKNTYPSWIKRAGKYIAIDKNNTVTKTLDLVIKNGMLSIKVKARKLGRLHILLKTISEAEAIIIGMGRFAEDTISFIEENGQEYIELFGLKFMKK